MCFRPRGRHRLLCNPTSVIFTLEKTKYFWEYYQWLYMSPTSKPHEVDVLLSCSRECSTSVHLFCPIISCPLGCFCPRLGVCLVRGFYFLSIMASPITAWCPDYKYFKKDPNYPHCCLCDVEISENPTS